MINFRKHLAINKATSPYQTSIVLIIALAFCGQTEAQPIGKTILDDGQPILNIGQRRSVAEGDRAALRAVARLNRKYPRAVLYYVRWTVRLGPGPLNKLTTIFMRTERSIQREDSTFPLPRKSVPDAGYGGITSAELQRIARQRGGQRELEKAASNYNYSNGPR